MPKRKFIVIGCQHNHISMIIEEFRELSFECAGIYERAPLPVAKAIAERFSIPLFNPVDYSGIEALNDQSVEIVASTAINSEKIDIVELSEKHGKHIILDKPLITSREGYKRLEAVIGRGAIQIGLLLTNRSAPVMYTLKKKINQGVLGRIVSISTRGPHRLAAANRPSWFFSREQNGGLVHDLLIHDFDMLRWLTGKEVLASDGYMAKCILPEYPTFYDTVNVQVLLEDHIVAHLYADWHTRDQSWAWGDYRYFVTGTKGAAELRPSGDPFISEEPLLLIVTNDEPLTSIPLESAPYTLCSDFLNRIESGNGVLTHKDILAAAKAVVEADEAVKTV